MKRRELAPADREALTRAVRQEQAGRERWDNARADLAEAIRQASENGASLRAIAEMTGQSHPRVRQIIQGDGGWWPRGRRPR